MSRAGGFDDAPHDYDAVLVVSFGGPEGPADVGPFLDNVFRGLRVSEETKARIAKRYDTFGGVSPLNAETRVFIKALQNELDAHGPALPIYWGNRNWHPLLGDTVRQMASAGVRRALAYVTSAFSSYSGCRRYREDLYEATRGVEAAPVIDKLRLPYNHPGFIEAQSDRVATALGAIPKSARATTPILFTAHSLPLSMASHCDYVEQLESACRLVADVVEHALWRLVYQSNNASYGTGKWLGPDISDALRELQAVGATHAVIAPIGFLSDHMEIVLDLDVDAAAIARSLGIAIVRAQTVGAHPTYVATVRELVCERMTANRQRRALGALGPSFDLCGVDCCLSGRRGAAKPALCGVDEPRVGSR